MSIDFDMHAACASVVGITIRILEAPLFPIGFRIADGRRLVQESSLDAESSTPEDTASASAAISFLHSKKRLFTSNPAGRRLL